MSYQSIKRVLGETNLERKCRILFGLCLFVLIGGAFLWADRVAEDLVRETTRSKGRDMVDIMLLRIHLEEVGEPGVDEIKEAVTGDLKTADSDKYRSNVIAFDKEQADSIGITDLEVKQASAEELDVIRYLESELLKRGTNKQEAAEFAYLRSDKARKKVEEEEQDTNLEPLFSELHDTERDTYNYYVPVRWKMSCTTACHLTALEDGAVPRSDVAATTLANPPLFVYRVEVPYAETRSAINQTRAILITAAIVTVFLSMVALYVIVRYVIVKPLKHLREVSDAISHGKTELRAELYTGDEFEDLADSFNRMLRHLIDAQSELRSVNTDLDAKVDELAQLNLQLHEMNQLKGEFLANMSHELRTPLNSIIGFSEVLQGLDSLSDKQKRYAGNIQKSGKLLLEMINDILDLAKIEAGKMEIRPSEFRIETLIQSLCDLVRQLTDEKNIDLEANLPPNSPPMYQDEVKLQRILTNLLSNAIKFTPEGGRIAVSARQDKQDRLELTVADTGVGIAEEDREIIFEKFRQSTALTGEDGLTREFSGTGLGLSIVKELCKLLGGTVSLESELGKGSKFKVLLPWVVANQALHEFHLTSKLNELTSPKRVDFQRAEEVPEPPTQVAASSPAPIEADSH